MLKNNRDSDVVRLRREGKKYAEIGAACGMSKQRAQQIVAKLAPGLVHPEISPRLDATTQAYYVQCIDKLISPKEVAEESKIPLGKVEYWMAKLGGGSISDRVMKQRKPLLKLFGERYPQGCSVSQAIPVFKEVCGREFAFNTIKRYLCTLGVKVKRDVRGRKRE